MSKMNCKLHDDPKNIQFNDITQIKLSDKQSIQHIKTAGVYKCIEWESY